MPIVTLDRDRFEAICAQIRTLQLTGPAAEDALRAAVVQNIVPRLPLQDTEAAAAFEFIQLDTNCDGALSQGELMAGLSDQGYTAREIEKLFFSMDIDGDGLVTREEFIQGYDTFRKHEPDCADMVPPGLLRQYSQWVRLNNCPGGCQFAVTNEGGVEEALAFTANKCDTGLKVFVKTFKSKYLVEARREWKITSEFLQPPHPNVTGISSCCTVGPIYLLSDPAHDWCGAAGIKACWTMKSTAGLGLRRISITSAMICLNTSNLSISIDQVLSIQGYRAYYSFKGVTIRL